MEFIIITMAVLSGVVIGYVNGRKNADEDWQLQIKALAQEIYRESDAGARGEKTEHSAVWLGGAAWVIRRLAKKGNGEQQHGQ